jgi:hypothetical protein
MDVLDGVSHVVALQCHKLQPQRDACIDVPIEAYTTNGKNTARSIKRQVACVISDAP